MEREKKTVEAMIRMYCVGHHSSRRALCVDCGELLAYARMRLQKCPFEQNKPTCATCTIHCYTPSMRARITSVMRYAGPRMLLKHPVLAVVHLANSRKNVARHRPREVYGRSI